MLPSIWQEVKHDHPDDWLCALEILELLKAKNIDDDLVREVTLFLNAKKSESVSMSKLIDDGFAML